MIWENLGKQDNSVKKFLKSERKMFHELDTLKHQNKGIMKHTKKNGSSKELHKIWMNIK